MATVQTLSTKQLWHYYEAIRKELQGRGEFGGLPPARETRKFRKS